MTFLLTANRGLHKRPGGWTPKELGTLSLWLDADDATTITVSTGVSQWDDKSGNGRNVTQATGANQPAWVKGAENGRAVVRFDGNNDFLSGGDALDLGTGGISAVAAVRNTVGGHVVTKTTSLVDSDGEWAMNTSQIGLWFGGGIKGLAVSETTGAHLHSWVVDRAASNKNWHNGTLIGNATSGYPNTDDLNTAANFVVGARDVATAAWMNGDIFEIVLSLATWTTEERQQVEGYLAHKWGTTASLPSNHPYKSAAP